ncbi:MAG: site-specific DNA-methyltransferase [bacterium]|nr:site-specific DNA-methyltransferase [bacterium]
MESIVLPPIVPFKPYYSDEAVTIYNADCRQVLPFLQRFDLLLTDPPYGIGFAAQPTKWQRRAGQKAEAWDNETPAAWTVQQMVEACDDAIVWGGNYYGLYPSRCWLSWHKPDAPPSMSNVEYAWTSMDKNSRQMTHSISATNAERVGHPTQKPLAIMRWCLSMASEAATVLDPFAGSGTTGVAAKLDGRKATLIEISEEYCEKAANRLQQGVLF